MTHSEPTMRYNTFLGAVIPLPDDDLATGVMQHDRISGEIELSDLEHDEWKKPTKVLYYPVTQYYIDCAALDLAVSQEGIDEWRKVGVTHVALILDGNDKEEGSFKFGAELVKCSGFLLLWSETTGKFRLQHCPNCVLATSYWLIMMQEKWHESPVGVQKGTRTYN